MKNHILKFLIYFVVLVLAIQDPLFAAGVAFLFLAVDSFFKFLNDVQESGKTG